MAPGERKRIRLSSFPVLESGIDFEGKIIKLIYWHSAPTRQTRKDKVLGVLFALINSFAIAAASSPGDRYGHVANTVRTIHCPLTSPRGTCRRPAGTMHSSYKSLQYGLCKSPGSLPGPGFIPSVHANL